MAGSGSMAGSESSRVSSQSGSRQGKAQVWTCPMDPQVKQARPGKCPICSMNLVPVESRAD